MKRKYTKRKELINKIDSSDWGIDLPDWEIITSDWGEVISDWDIEKTDKSLTDFITQKKRK
jgi:hypothetical protein